MHNPITNFSGFEKAFVTSGIRLGTPSVTTRGMKEKEMVIIAGLIARVLDNRDNISKLKSIRKEVNRLTGKFPVYGSNKK